MTGGGGVGEALLERADRNMTAAWTGIVRGIAGAGAVAASEDLLLLSSGIPVPLFNPAFPLGGGDDPAAVVARVRTHYGRLGSPFALYFREEAAPGLAEACQAAGLVEHWQPPLMVLDGVPEPPPPPAGLEVVPVDAGSLADYVAVVAEGFGMPLELARKAFGAWLLDLQGFTGFLGLDGGVPAASSGLFGAAGLAGVYNVATVPARRGRGLGAAMTWAAVGAGRRHGLTVSVLQASRAGEPVYRRMGYVVGARYRQFEPAPR